MPQSSSTAIKRFASSPYTSFGMANNSSQPKIDVVNEQSEVAGGPVVSSSIKHSRATKSTAELQTAINQGLEISSAYNKELASHITGSKKQPAKPHHAPLAASHTIAFPSNKIAPTYGSSVYTEFLDIIRQSKIWINKNRVALAAWLLTAVVLFLIFGPLFSTISQFLIKL